MKDRFEPPRPRKGSRLDVIAYRTEDGVATDSVIREAAERLRPLRWNELALLVTETPDVVGWYCGCAAKVLPNGDVATFRPCDRHQRKAERGGAQNTES